MTDRQRLTILGSTGSVGASTLDVVARHPDRFEVIALTAQNRTDILLRQCLEFRPKVAVVLEAEAAHELRRRLAQAGSKCEVRSGADALEAVASLKDVDTVMAAIV